jgi:tRNA pseudouridine38-40 synthase
MVLNEPIQVTGCGRTDTGVHAKDYYAHFDTTKTDLIANHDKWIYKLNSVLPNDIAVYQLIEVGPEASTRFDATSRTYEYWISKQKNPFMIDAANFIHSPLNLDAMNNAAKILLDYTDFSCFSKSNTQTFTNNCKITEAYWKEENNCIVFTITADRFLRNMVRAIVGTLLEIGEGKTKIEELKSIIESKNRSNAGASVPACGLYLTKIKYPTQLIKE